MPCVPDYLSYNEGREINRGEEMIEILLDQFMFGSLWNGGIFMFSAFAIILHLFILPHDERHSVWKTVSFIMGFVIIFAAVGSPLNIVARIQFSMHVIQMILLLFIAPPLLIMGCKQKSLDYVKKRFPKLDRINNPILSFILFFVFLYSYHIPILFDTARMDLFLNYFYLLALFIASILFWIPILSPKKLSSKNKVRYISIGFVLMLPFFLTWALASENLYRTYTDMSSFIKAIELCLPKGETLSEEYYLLLLPFDPVDEQFKGGVIWFLSLLSIFGTTILLIKKSIKKLHIVK